MKHIASSTITLAMLILQLNPLTPNTLVQRNSPTQSSLQAEAVISRYVSSKGNDNSSSNPCTDQSTPCKTIQRAINASNTGDTVYIANGTYTFAGTENPSPNVVIISQSISLSGGWTENFNTQNGVSIIDGENVNNGILAMNAGINVIVDHFVIQNSFSANGGGIFIAGANFTLKNSTVRNNHADGIGAGISAGDSPMVTILNSTIGENIGYSGAGISASNTTVNIEFSTIAYNQGTLFGAVLVESNSTIDIKNSILANNTVSSEIRDCSGSITSLGFNVISSTTLCGIQEAPGVTIDKFNVDPKINNMLSNVPPVYALLEESPAIDYIDPSGCPETDEINTHRPIDGDGDGVAKCDSGAFEYIKAGIPVSISVANGDLQEKTINQAFDMPLSVLVLDGYRDPVRGMNVTFDAPSYGPSGTFAISGTTTETAVTNELGIATTSTFTANNRTGGYSVTSSVNGVIESANFSLRNRGTPGIPATISLVSGNSQSSYLNQKFAFPLAVKVLDDFEDPVSNVTVVFTAPITGASCNFAATNANSETVITDSSGVATTSILTAIGLAGEYEVIATTSGVMGSVNFTLQNKYNEVYLPLVMRPIPLPGPFNKVSPSQNAIDEDYGSPDLLWFSNSLYAANYEYCIDTVNNDSCDTTWNFSSTGIITLAELDPSTTYYWQVRAVNGSGVTYADNGTWWSFTTIWAPTAGYWQSQYGSVKFYITSDQTIIRNFSVLVNLEGCGSYWISRAIPSGDVEIDYYYYSPYKYSFDFSGNLSGRGEIPSPIGASGTLSINNVGPICGYYWSGGPYNWSATWQNANQPSSLKIKPDEPILLKGEPGITTPFTAKPVK